MDRGGSRLKWALTAIGRLRWQIAREREAFVLSVSGDHTPTWRFASIAEARAFAERIEGSAPIGEDGWWPVVVVQGSEVMPVESQPGTEGDAERCHHCGSEVPPVLMKPLTYTITWWDDPEGRWICPDCDRARASAANVRWTGAILER